MEKRLSMDDGYELINGRKIVKKHIATIHCINRLSLLERKISNALLFHAFPDLKKTLIHEISLDRLKRLLNSVTRNHKALKNALRTLISTVIEWNILGEKVPELELDGWNASTILSSVSVKDGLVKYQYSELMKSLITDPSIYGKINLLIQSRFKSAYALALYENCARYRGLKYTKEFPFPIFRKLMGVAEGKYEIFRDFNRRVLSPAVTEINTCSDIFITPDIKRRAGKPHSIKFTIEERAIKKRIGRQSSSKTTLRSRPVSDNSSVKELSVEFGIEEGDLKKLLLKFGENRVGQAANYVRSRASYKAGEVTNKAGYLRSAIEKGFNFEIADPREKQAQNTKRKESQKRKSEKVEFENLKHEYRRYIVGETKRMFDFLPSEKQKEIEEGFVRGDHNFRDACYHETLGINNVLVFESGLTDYLCAKHPELTEDLLNFECFQQQLIT